MKSVTASFSRTVPKLQATRSMPDNRSNPGVPTRLQTLPLLVPLLPIRSTNSTSANRSPTSRPSKGGFRINLREDKVVAKWLDKLKSCFGVKPGEVMVVAAGIDVGKATPTPEMAFVKAFQPRVGQLMLDEFQIHAVLEAHQIRVHNTGKQGSVVWNPKKRKFQILRSKPLVAINHFSQYSDYASISLYGNDVYVKKTGLQFK